MQARPAQEEVTVCHLVWAPLGVGPLEGFVRSYLEHRAGLAHRLVVILNGFDGPGDVRLAELEPALARLECERVFTPEPLLDLAAYRHAAQQLGGRRICFVNSYSKLLAADWLAMLAAPLDDPAVGLTATCGSYESARSQARPWALSRYRDFAPFPNPHVRTNGFMIERTLLLELEWPRLDTRLATLRFESGARSISRQVWERGLEIVVVGRDGVAHPPARWRESATFRSAGQRNLLIADNRTAQYAAADAGLRVRLERMAWGSGASVARMDARALA